MEETVVPEDGSWGQRLDEPLVGEVAAALWWFVLSE